MTGDRVLAPTRPLRLTDAVAAFIVHEDGRYLLQKRDDSPRIPFPGHWGLFGGTVEAGETDEQALRRELIEELAFRPRKLVYATKLEVDLDPMGLRRCYRAFFEAPISEAEMADLVLGEGAGMGLFSGRALLMEERITPYDAYALWLHMNEGLFRLA